MMETTKKWFYELSQREQILITIMLVLTAMVLLWFALVQPLITGLDTAKDRHRVAVERHAAIMAKVDRINSSADAAKMPLEQPLATFISQSAGEQGFTLGTNAPRGDGQVEITIASAKPAPLFAWINNMVDNGISVREIAVKSGANGTVAVTATLVGYE